MAASLRDILPAWVRVAPEEFESDSFDAADVVRRASGGATGASMEKLRAELQSTSQALSSLVRGRRCAARCRDLEPLTPQMQLVRTINSNYSELMQISHVVDGVDELVRKSRPPLSALHDAVARSLDVLVGPACPTA